MLAIRLTRVGKKNSPAYRVVVADKRRAVKRKFVEILGHYNPTQKPKDVAISKDRALFWLERGAQPSDTVRNLMCDLGILDKKVNKKYAKVKPSEEGEAKAEVATKAEAAPEVSSTEEPEAKEATTPAETEVESESAETKE